MSRNTYQKEEKERILKKFVIYTVWPQFTFFFSFLFTLFCPKNIPFSNSGCIMQIS